MTAIPNSILFQIPLQIEAEMTPAVKAFVLAAFASFEKRIAQLEAKPFKLTPQNSSLPPSAEHPHAKLPGKPKTGKKRKQGGQKGHKKHSRELVPTEQCDQVIACVPTDCRKCGGDLKPTESEPVRHQVWELPPIKPIVTEYQLHRGHCCGCGITTCGELPAGVPTGQCGPRLAAFSKRT